MCEGWGRKCVIVIWVCVFELFFRRVKKARRRGRAAARASEMFG